MFDPRDLIGALDAARIEYVVIDGFAVAAHGHVRATKDLDTSDCNRTPGRSRHRISKSTLQRATGSASNAIRSVFNGAWDSRR